MKIEVLYFEGCPNHRPTVERVHEVVAMLGIEASVREIDVGPQDDPTVLKFLGSPTVLIDGRDIDPSKRDAVAYGLSCRTYAGAGVPSKRMIEDAIHETQMQG